jgi:hypothetical protein
MLLKIGMYSLLRFARPSVFEIILPQPDGRNRAIGHRVIGSSGHRVIGSSGQAKDRDNTGVNFF